MPVIRKLAAVDSTSLGSKHNSRDMGSILLLILYSGATVTPKKAERKNFLHNIYVCTGVLGANPKEKP